MVILLYVYHDEKTSATVYRIDLAAGKREPVTTFAPVDPAGVTSVLNVRMTADGKAYAYSFLREMSDLFFGGRSAVKDKKKEPMSAPSRM